MPQTVVRVLAHQAAAVLVHATDVIIHVCFAHVRVAPAMLCGGPWASWAPTLILAFRRLLEELKSVVSGGPDVLWV